MPREPTTPVEPVQKGENAIRRKLIPVLRPKPEIVKVAQHTLTLVIFNHVTLPSVLAWGMASREGPAYFLQRHASVDLIDINCELVLDALHLDSTSQSGH